jgi:two-component system alkaline phosphatase synthesis response regulator PhoP
MANERILIVDDEEDVLELVRYNLERNGYQVTTAGSGEQALANTAKKPPDLVVLDLMLPGIDGLEVCKKLKSEVKTEGIPIIMLTAKGEESDIVLGLNLGADDYVTKPFDPKEIVSRVRAVLRRSESTAVSKSVYRVGDISIDIEKHSVHHEEKSIDLTAIEFEIYKALAENPGRVYSRAQLLDRIQGDTYEGYERTIDTHIKNLRKKLDIPSQHPGYIVTVYGVGYKLGEG